MNHQASIIQQLRKEILLLGGHKTPTAGVNGKNGLRWMQAHFPLQTFPTAAIHEFLSVDKEQQVASAGFIAATISECLPNYATVIWIQHEASVFAPALVKFGIEPHKVIFLQPANEKETNWCVEEALRCSGITAVVAEMKDVNFTNSRRFQLAVEKSKVTGFMLNTSNHLPKSNACVSRWQITSLPSATSEGMPGIGNPRWKIQLLKMRNGQPGTWQVEWTDGHFQALDQATFIPVNLQAKTG